MSKRDTIRAMWTRVHHQPFDTWLADARAEGDSYADISRRIGVILGDAKAAPSAEAVRRWLA